MRCCTVPTSHKATITNCAITIGTRLMRTAVIDTKEAGKYADSGGSNSGLACMDSGIGCDQSAAQMAIHSARAHEPQLWPPSLRKQGLSMEGKNSVVVLHHKKHQEPNDARGVLLV